MCQWKWDVRLAIPRAATNVKVCYLTCLVIVAIDNVILQCSIIYKVRLISDSARPVLAMTDLY